MSNLPRILWVDDELSLVSSMKRQLRNDFAIDGAYSGAEGLNFLRHEDPYAVIVSDLKMPGMNGIEFLSQAKDLSPDSVRIMLTGFAEQDTAIDAVNEGAIFRFLTKPCPPGTVMRSLKDAVRQYQLQIAERELLEETLTGSIQVLTDVLALANPVAFSRASRVRDYCAHMAAEVKLPKAWQVSSAAMLYHLGYVTLPGPLLEKHYAGRRLTDPEEAMLNAQLDTSGRMLTKIPRLEGVIRIMYSQSASKDSQAVRQKDEEALAAHILRVALEFDRLMARGFARNEALRQLISKPTEFNADVVQALASAKSADTGLNRRNVQINALKNGMIVDEEVRTPQGMLLVPRGYTVNDAVRQRLRNFLLQDEIEDSIAVLIPESVDEEA